ncbi:MAG TPA: hypothetical protein PJ991_12345 [Kiritimatiellia bacterium]|nr:hypothetical protein [Kiritimatiellia bacterium]
MKAKVKGAARIKRVVIWCTLITMGLGVASDVMAFTSSKIQVNVSARERIASRSATQIEAEKKDQKESRETTRRTSSRVMRSAGGR